MNMNTKIKMAYKAIVNYIDMINKNKINKPSFVNSEDFYKSNYEKS